MTPQVAGEAEARWSDLMTPALAPRAALILLGVWLNAADALVSVTIMPTLVRELGGAAYYGWAVASISPAAYWPAPVRARSPGAWA